MQMTILLTFVASMFLLVLSKSAKTLNEAAALDTANKVVSLTADKIEAHRLVKRQADFEFEEPEVTFFQCQSLGVTPFTGLPLGAITSLFAQADADNNGVLTNFELLYFGNAMQVYLQCANPAGEFEN
ncbi:uncharacterized protein [Littorina saxatilis]|uniref:uncharacterized protein n=1 Tax=Littorina saxatilis TaxID=31220 RepID=UPI0038B4754D